jgi:hypothetical protein
MTGGAGGLGRLLSEQLASFDYRGVVTTLIALIVLTNDLARILLRFFTRTCRLRNHPRRDFLCVPTFDGPRKCPNRRAKSPWRHICVVFHIMNHEFGCDIHAVRERHPEFCTPEADRTIFE